MPRSSRTVSARIGLHIAIAPQTVLPLAATFSYSREDPYAVRVAFQASEGEPVQWYFARDLLAAGIQGRAGLGDVRVWPSAGSTASAPGSVLTIELTSPSGRARLEASVKQIRDFLRRTYQLVPPGAESEHGDTEAELSEMLRHAS
jgi:Streptomyces sporulation and cell division protein, SsgA